jgi:hypothetical protein
MNNRMQLAGPLNQTPKQGAQPGRKFPPSACPAQRGEQVSCPGQELASIDARRPQQEAQGESESRRGACQQQDSQQTRAVVLGHAATASAMRRSTTASWGFGFLALRDCCGHSSNSDKARLGCPAVRPQEQGLLLLVPKSPWCTPSLTPRPPAVRTRSAPGPACATQRRRALHAP